MTYALVFVAVLIIIPIAIACLIVVGRKELWRAIALFSIIAIIAEAINFVLWILQVAHRLPHASSVPSGVTTPVDAIRVFASGLAEYTAAAAWLLSLLASAQQRRVIWAPVLTLTAIVSLIGLYVVEHPYSFFPRSSYAFGYELLLILIAHISAILTLIFAFVIRPRQVPVSTPPATYAPPPGVAENT